MSTNSLVLFLFLIPLLLLFIRTRISSRTNSNKKSPPSPTRFPVIGNLHQLGTHPHRSFHTLSQKYGPLMLLYMGRVPTLIVSSADIVREIVKNHDVLFSNRPKTTAAYILLYKGKDVGFAPYGEYWRNARKLCVLELLSLRRVQQFQFVKDEETAMLVDRISKAANFDGSVNFTNMMVDIANNIMSRCILGRPFVGEEGTSKFGELAKRFMVNMMAFSLGDFFPSLSWVDKITGLTGRLEEIFRELDSFFDELINERMDLVEARSDEYNNRSKDLLDILLGLKNNEMIDHEFTRDNMKGLLADLFIGGSDTTSTTLVWIMAELLRSPSSMRKVQDEIRRVVGKKKKIETEDLSRMDYLKCVIRETMRLHPAAPLLIPRETTASVEVGGFYIQEKTRVLINAWAIQRDPNVWDKADEFIPERFDESSVDFKGQHFELIPFGVGRRGCPGMAFGVADVEHVIANILYWFDWELPNSMKPEEMDMTEVYGLTVRKKLPLDLIPKVYSH